MILLVIALVVSFTGTASAANGGPSKGSGEPRVHWDNSEPPGYPEEGCPVCDGPQHRYGWPSTGE